MVVVVFEVVDVVVTVGFDFRVMGIFLVVDPTTVAGFQIREGPLVVAMCFGVCCRCLPSNKCGRWVCPVRTYTSLNSLSVTMD